jgi:hypothetical protein
MAAADTPDVTVPLDEEAKRLKLLQIKAEARKAIADAEIAKRGPNDRERRGQGSSGWPSQQGFDRRRPGIC